MANADLRDVYRRYIDCLNGQQWQRLGDFVHDHVHYNGHRIGLSGYREMLEGSFDAIPDLYFDVQLLISNPPFVASRLVFECTPRKKFLGLDVEGRSILLAENVFYEFWEERIEKVWSVLDKIAVEAQLNSQCSV